MISWKYAFKRLNEEYEIANKKKQALDKLLESGKISQSTRDSFANDINAAIVQIERQQKELIENMQLKTQELENQIKTLEVLLANYEIQHVVGEIDEQIYQQEINLLTTGLETTRNELNGIKQTTNQLISPTTIQAPAAPEPAAPIVEAKVSEPAPIEPTPVEVPVEAATIVTTIEPSPVPLAPIETAPAENPIETEKVEANPIESAPTEITPVEAAPIEIVSAPVEPAPVDVATVETPTAEVPPAEAPIVPPEPEVQVINEPTPEIAPQEPAITEPAVQEPAINVEEAAPQAIPAVEQPAAEAEPTEIAPTEAIVEAEPEQNEVKVPLQDFEVISEAAPIETTLEKVMESVTEPINEPLIVEEITVPAHPLEAPQAGQTVPDQSAASETEESSEEKTE